MGLTSALYTGLSGLNASQFRLDIIGDNIANINTTGFKGSRTLFQTQFARTLSAGNKPTGVQGGTNPSQVGLGATVGSIQRSFTAGSIETTGISSDLAIEGEGFFVLRSPGNESVYSRDGAFGLSADKRLTAADGFFVQGYSVDSDFNIIPSAVGDLTIPLGTLTTARATENAQFEGTLKSSGTVATQGTILRSQQLFNATTSAQLTDVTGPGTDLTNISSSAGGPALFATGDVISAASITRGARDVPAQDFVVGTTGTTVADLLSWMDEVIGIDTTAGVAGNPGTAVTADGRLEIRGNAGTENALEIDPGALVSNNATTKAPFAFTEDQTANGESAHTTFVVYDSLGKPISVDLTMVLEQQSTGSSTWRYYATAGDDTDLDFSLGTGTIDFDAAGQFVQAPQDSIVIDRAGVGSVDPLSVKMDFTKLSGLNVNTSSLVMGLQDGFSTGTLVDYSVGQDGIITGTFTNGLNQTLGQVALATFANPGGLLARSNNIFFVGPNSGEARIGPPLTLGSGGITSGALELSNVDLSREFINLITSSTAFSAASRVVSTSDQLLQELLLVARR